MKSNISGGARHTKVVSDQLSEVNALRLLYVTANPKPLEQSYSLQVGAHFLAQLRQLRADLSVETVDCYNDYIPLIDATVFALWEKMAENTPLDANEQRIATRMEQILEQFLAADTYVFVTPLWNLSYPPLFKAYLDNVIIAHKTFRYTEVGAVGLLQDLGKQVVHIQASGGFHSTGPTPEFANSHLKAIMGFIGIQQYYHVVAEGMAYQPEQADHILASAKTEAAKVAVMIAKAKQSD
jgi:FMN-dependent NADH-azoreductase